MLLDRFALENHSHIATKAERIRNSTHWILTLNEGGAQQPSHQRTWLYSREKRMQDIARRTHGKPRSQQIRQRKAQAFEGIEEYDYAVDPRTGWRFFQESREIWRQFRPRQQIGIETIGRRAVGIPSMVKHTSWSDDSWNIFLRVDDQFRVPGEKLPDNRRWVWTEHPLKQHVQMRTAWSPLITRTRVA